MKVYQIDAYFTDSKTRHIELYFEFAYGDRATYFEANEGEWNHGFWITKGEEGDTISTDDLDCWIDRIPSEELSGDALSSLIDKMTLGRVRMGGRLSNGESITYQKRGKYEVTVSCLYKGSVNRLPKYLSFDKGRSLEAV